MKILVTTPEKKVLFSKQVAVEVLQTEFKAVAMRAAEALNLANPRVIYGVQVAPGSNDLMVIDTANLGDADIQPQVLVSVQN